MDQTDMDVNRKLSVFKHRKKQASNDAQLLMNRIALLQKEEERARKKIDMTKDRAAEILAMRSENEKRMMQFLNAGSEEAQQQQQLREKNKDQDIEGKKARQAISDMILNKRKEDAVELQMQKKQLTKMMLKEQERELRLKQQKRDEVRRTQEAARLRREEEAREKERKVREFYERKAAEEEAEARRAEKLVKELERKEREWISKLRNAQLVQENAFEHLESALMKLPEFPPSPKKGSPGSLVVVGDAEGLISGPPTNSSFFGKAGGGGGGGGSKPSSASKLSRK